MRTDLTLIIAWHIVATLGAGKDPWVAGWPGPADGPARDIDSTEAKRKYPCNAWQAQPRSAAGRAGTVGLIS